MNTKQQEQFSFRPANSQKDIELIYDLILEGSQNGNFAKDYTTKKEAAKGLKIELVSIVLQNKRINGTFSYAIIYEVANTSIGFVIMSAIEGNQGNEIYMASIHPKYRGQGYGKQMVRSITEQFIGKNLILIARCHTNSEKMYQILLNNGFKLETTGKEGYRGLVFTL